ncbi:hypothetical protein BDI4_1080034 [Burkholderia diffusa]|uniref:YqaJ viral recombinase family nuclease n=1 Tax=Burkholderia diffusa TaxID=488732 RepID=UPI001CACC671|nr:YqaJ viral recombinase family protein [Burkholderia diffusa]CAG9241801.1 hypothetical protein BDI4_1080034 [Burkholderia diffusa]
MNAVQPGRPRTRRPALKLVKTRELSRNDWLAVRRTGIGGSDAAAAVGLNPYMSPLELWLDKTGRADGMPRPDPNDTTAATYWGTLLEPIVAAVYTQQTGNKVRKVNAVLRHPTIPWMLANIDREVVGARDVQILECKTAGEFGARLWRDGVPEYIQLQVQHQLAVTGKTAAHVAVLLCGQALEVHRIDRDDLLTGLGFAAVLEGVACLLWTVALRSPLPKPLPVVTGVTPTEVTETPAVTRPVVAPVTDAIGMTQPAVMPIAASHGDETVSRNSVTPNHDSTTDSHSPRDDPITPLSTVAPIDDHLSQLVRDVTAGLVRPTVADIRRHLGCSQARAAKLRRQLAGHNLAA